MNENMKNLGTPVLSGEVRYSNSLFDLILAAMLSQLWGGGLLILIVAIAAVSYFQLSRISLPIDDPMLSVLLVMKFVFIFFAVMLVWVPLFTLFRSFAGKLKGVIGEHYLTFRETEFVEKTIYNESVFKYSSVTRLADLPAYYLIMVKGHQYFFIPKRHLDRQAREKLIGTLTGGKGARPHIVPFIVVSAVLLAFVFYEITIHRKVHRLVVFPSPFMALTAGDRLFVLTGREISRNAINYGTYIGATTYGEDPDAGAFDPRENMRSDRRLWLVTAGRQEQLVIPDDIDPQTLFLEEDLPYLIGSDRVAQEPKLLKWNGAQFVLDPAINLRDFMQKRMQKKFAQMKAAEEMDEDTERARSEPGLIREHDLIKDAGDTDATRITLGNRVFFLSLKRTEMTGTGLDAAGSYRLTGRWEGGDPVVFLDSPWGTVQVNEKGYRSFTVPAANAGGRP